MLNYGLLRLGGIIICPPIRKEMKNEEVYLKYNIGLLGIAISRKRYFYSLFH
jgi:hypothetical protein